VKTSQKRITRERKHALRRCLALIFLFFALIQTQCVTPEKGDYGVQAEQLARIPARIAVVPCRAWPQGARFVNQPELKASPEDLKALCEKFDQYVLQGFDGQPYMRGISPRVVLKLLEQSQQPDLLTKIDELWFRPGQACESCQHPASYYREVIAPRPDWRAWLTNFARSASQSDALLLPLVIEADKGTLNDRGLIFNFRRARIALLLIDTNNGELIWIGGRETESRLPKEKGAPDTLPDLEDFYRNLFIPDLWLEFPGRQTN
jgi:hypothetical protein